jgi:protocatechuate 3,4-dioxygenase beta subunit
VKDEEVSTVEAGDRERLELVYTRSVEALREVVRELRISEEELHLAGRFFNRLGASGFFPSLLDIAFAMTTIDARRAQAGTRPNLEGPFYRPGAPLREDGVLFERRPGPKAEVCTLEGRVTEVAGGGPIKGAELDLWQADENGEYDLTGFNLRGVVRTGPDGRYRVTTVLPFDYPQHQDDPIGELLEAMGMEVFRAAHIHLKVRVGGEERLTTQFFMADSPHLDSDYVVGAVTPDLVIPKQVSSDGEGKTRTTITFDIALPPQTARVS